MDLSKFFKAKSIAVIGVSKYINKAGHVLFKNLLDSKYKGKLYAVNPNEEEVLEHRCYDSVLEIKGKVDLGIVAIPSNLVLKVVQECGKKGIKNLVIITAGFEEIGNTKLHDDLLSLLKKYKIKVIGPNCLGIYDSYSRIDSIFFPQSRMKRPEQGGISLVCQSGAVGGALLDLGAKKDYKFSKFISYGNAINVDESDILEYLSKDVQTKVICLYIEGVKDGKKFLRIARKIKKPVIVLKAGSTEQGSEAALSHTGALAGEAKIYKGVFEQAGLIQANGLEELFEFAKVFLSKEPRGDSIQIITNGGGYGILCTDNIIHEGLDLAQMDQNKRKKLRTQLPKIAVIKNPIDLTGSATTKDYERAIKESISDRNIDIVLLTVLYQTPTISTDIVKVISKYSKKKPIVVVSTGARFTDILNTTLELSGVPTYTFPKIAVKSIRKLVDYYL
ncbi:acetate--CoA ligase family protein [Nanoarchaeota archaeon]